MWKDRQELDAAIRSELKARLAVLREKSYRELARLPEAESDEATILGKPVAFTLFCDHRADGSLLILIRSDKRILFGIGSAGTTEGFFVSPGGERREAYGDEISEFFA